MFVCSVFSSAFQCSDWNQVSVEWAEYILLMQEKVVVVSDKKTVTHISKKKKWELWEPQKKKAYKNRR